MHVQYKTHKSSHNVSVLRTYFTMTPLRKRCTYGAAVLLQKGKLQLCTEKRAVCLPQRKPQNESEEGTQRDKYISVIAGIGKWFIVKVRD